MMKRAGRSILGSACLAAAASGSAVAAPADAIRLGVSAATEYNTNVARGSILRANARNLNRGDVRFRPALTASGTKLFGRQSLTLAALAGYDFYARNSRLNRERIAIDALGGLSFGRCAGSAGLSFSRRQSELGDFVFVNNTDLTSFKNTETITTVSGSARCGAAVGLKPTVSVSQSWARNGSARREFAEYNSTSLAGGIAYERPSFGLLSLLGTYGRTTFPNRQRLFGPAADGAFTTYGGAVRLERQLFSRLTGTAQIGYTRVNPDAPGVRDFSGPTWLLAASAAVSSRLTVGANVERSIRSSNLVAASYFVLESYGGRASYAVGDRTTVSVYGDHSQRRFRGSEQIIGIANVRDTTDTLGGSVAFAVNRKLNLSLYADHTRRNTIGALDDYSNNRIGISAAYTFR